MKLGIFTYVNKLLLKGKVIYLSFIIGSIISILLYLIITLLNKTVDDLFVVSNMKMLIIPIVTASAYLSFSLAIVAFSSTKHNNVDLYLYTRPIKKTSVLYLKQLSIFLWVESLSFVQSIIFLIFLSVWNVSIHIIVATFFLIVAGTIISNILLIMTFTYITIKYKQIKAIIISTCVSGVIIAFQFLPVIPSGKEISVLSYDKETYYNNYLKIINVGDDGNLDNVQTAIEIIGTNKLNQTTNISSKSSFSQWNPTQMLSSPYDYLLSNFVNYDIKNDTLNVLGNHSDKWSYKKYDLNIHPEGVEFKTDNMMYVPYDLESPLEISKLNVEKNVLKIIKDFDLVEVDFTDSEYWDAFVRKISTSETWTGLLSQSQTKIISYFSGIENKSRFIWYLKNQWNYVPQKVINIENVVKDEYSLSFAKFLKFIWFSPIAYDNIMTAGVIKEYEEIRSLHPVSYIYDELSEATSSDIKYIKDKLVYLNLDASQQILSFKVLSKKGIYVDVENYSDLFDVNIVTKDDWNNYVDDNKPIVNLSNFLDKLNEKVNGEMAHFSFKDNVVTYDLISDTFDIKYEAENSMLIWYFLLFIVSSLLLQSEVMTKVKRKDIL